MTQFETLLAGSATLQARFKDAAAYVIDAVEKQYGVKITPEDVMKMSSVKISVLADSDDYKEEWIGEASVIPSITRAEEEQRLIAALEKEQLSPENDLLVQKLVSMRPAQKLAYCRAHGISLVAKMQEEAKGPQTPEERARLVAENQAIKSGGRKMAHARQHGLC